MDTRAELHPWIMEKKCLACVQAMQQSGFDAHYCPDGAAARKIILAAAENSNTIGFGGSITLKELGLFEALDSMGKELLIHNKPEYSLEQKTEIRRRQLLCDLFLTSTNALTMDGKLVNIDGIGNRVAAMVFGPKKVIVVCGRNKLVNDVHQALDRIKNYAAPANAKRLDYKLNCAQTGFCSDCQSPHRICNITVIIEKKPVHTDMTVLLVNEDLGL